MKRIGKTSNLIDEIVEYGNISNSVDVILRGRMRKQTRNGRYILEHRDEVIAKIQKEIKDGVFQITSYTEMEVKDGGKVRKIQFVNRYEERIGCNAIMRVVEKHVFGRYIRTTSASIKGRGMHDLKEYIQKDMEFDPEGTKYCYKFDIRKFYESVNQDFMMYALRRLFKDRLLLTLLERFVRLTPNGLSIGLRSSQGFGNMLLSLFLDHYLKDQFGVKYYYRYCDDGVVLDGSKKKLWIIRNIVHECADFMQLTIKPDERVFPTSQGIDFLGFVMYKHDYVRLRKRNKKNAARKLHCVKSKKRRQEVIAALYGQCKHANCHNLFYKLSGIKMNEYKKLSRTGIKPKYEDGKKRFDGKEVNLADLVGEEFVVVDYEVGLKTKVQRKEYDEAVARQRKELENYTTHDITPPKGFVYPEQVPLPVGKYLISIIRNVGTPNECLVKAFTGDGENKSILDQMRELHLLKEEGDSEDAKKGVCCSIKTVRCKGFNRYVLC